MWPDFLSGYLKLSVVLIALVFLIKMAIALLLCSEYNIEEGDVQEVYICGKVFRLRAD